MNDFKQLMEEICQELDIKLEIISNGWIFVLEKDGVTRFTTGTCFDNNTHAIGNFFDDKYGTYALLKNMDIPVIEHQIAYNSDNNNDYAIGCNTRKYVYDFFDNNQNNIVLKANRGFGGKEVYHITKKEDIDKALDSLFQKSYSISMCPFYYIKNEYRLFVLDGNVELVYKKIKPVVVGDGHSTILELLKKLNNHFFTDDMNNLDVVLKNGENFEYNWQFNLSGGAVMSLDIEKKKKAKLLDLAKMITDKIDIGFATIDVVELETDDFLVMEINSGVGMAHFRQLAQNGREISKELYKKAIKKMFNL